MITAICSYFFLFYNYNNMLSEIKGFVKDKFYDIMLVIIVVLLLLLSYAVGYITAKYQSKTPIEIEYKK